MSDTQSLPVGHFIKSLREALNLDRMALKHARTNFFGGAPKRKPMASAVRLGSLDMGSML